MMSLFRVILFFSRFDALLLPTGKYRVKGVLDMEGNAYSKSIDEVGSLGERE